MKKFLLSLFTIISIASSLHAQIGKGSLWLGGGVGYSKSENNDTSYPYTMKTLSINPSIGIAISDNLIVGVTLSYSIIDDNASRNYYLNSKNKQYGGGIFVRQYIPVVNRLYIFGEGDATYTTFKFDKTIDDGNRSHTYNKGWTCAISFYPGVSFALTKKLQIEAGFNNLLSIQYTKRKNNENSFYGEFHSNNFNARLNLENGAAFTLGFHLLLNNKS